MKRRAGEPGIRLVNRAYRYFQLNDVPENIAFGALETLSAQLASMVVLDELNQDAMDMLWQSVLETSRKHGRAPGAQAQRRSLHQLPVERGSIGYADL